ncbi:MAG: molybdenum cofactor biosynthesis protein MoaE [Chloroflexi bacterium]|nr:molybdenum cofactor biosynthesis protein MoaE [Chloroflexota bacterium]
MGSMKVVVRLFASYREAAGTGRIELDLPVGATADDALRAISLDHAIVAEQVMLARNREYVTGSAALADGDELALIPPVSGGGSSRIAVSETALSVDDTIAHVRDTEVGGIVVFIGTVRRSSQGRHVTRLDYEAYAEMAQTVMAEIADRLGSEHGARIALHHRTGVLAVGDIAVIVAAGAPHRAAAFTAARAAIDELKRIVPIWKKEYADDGAVWVTDHA